MRFDDFRSLVEAMAGEVPASYLDGVAGIEVRRQALPHPTRADVYTMGECIPLNTGGDVIQSRVVLYHGSFAALAADQAEFDWRAEAWETLTHELRHHLEWRAQADQLDAYDWAAEQNFARSEGDAFDPVFHLSGEQVAPGVYKVDDDFFLDRVVRTVPPDAALLWHGRMYRVTLPSAALPLFVTLDGLAHPAAGAVVLVLRRRPRLTDLWRRSPAPTSVLARVMPVE